MSHNEKIKIIIIQGPTGVGKTAVTLALAKKFPIEIINADSMQFYKYMDIGTSKPTSDEQAVVPHHLFSIVEPDKDFNAARFMEKGRQAVEAISARGKTPVVAGGTGLYLKALTRGLFPAPEVDTDLRRSFKKKSREELFKKLCEVDYDASTRINPNDAVRIIRALEVFYLTGIPLSRHHKLHGFQDEPYSSLKICLTRDRQNLYRRIERRVDQMIAKGFLQEVQILLDRGYAPQLKSMQAIGYKSMIQFIQGSMAWDRAVDQIKKETRNLAKRQLTWFKQDKTFCRIELPEQIGEIDTAVKKFLNIQ